MKPSRRASGVTPSTTIAIDEKARRLAASGTRVWNLGAGQPDFPTPPCAAEAGIEAIRAGRTTYTSPNGTIELRTAIAEKLGAENGVVVTPEEVLVGAGAKQSIYTALAAVLDDGDEVLLPAPYWVSYPEQVRLLGGVPKVIETDESTGFTLTPEALTRAIGPRSRVLMINSPNNPTGAVYDRAQLEALARIVVERDLLLITDEIYETIVFGGAEHVSVASLGREIAARTLTVNGVSKSFSMTGWRIGYAAGPRQWVDAAAGIQSHLSGNASSISQAAAIAALRDGGVACREMAQVFAVRRERVAAILARAPRLRVCPPRGAFYVFPDVSSYLGLQAEGRVIDTVDDLAAWLLETAHVAVVPGSAFGSSRHVRLSFAASNEVLDAGYGAFVDGLERLR